jgi:hypothetical protein
VKLATAQALELQKQHRPLIAGASVTNYDTDGVTPTFSGSLGWVVRQANGDLCLLGFRTVFGAKDAKVYQPSFEDGGSENDEIAVVTATAEIRGTEFRSPTLATLRPGIMFDPNVPRIGIPSGIQEKVKDDTPVVLLGRGAGLIQTKITSTDFEGDYVLDYQSDLSDMGAPVFTEDGKLVGLLLGSSHAMSWVVPINELLTPLKLTEKDLVFEIAIAGQGSR